MSIYGKIGLQDFTTQEVYYERASTSSTGT
jgi:hypothetical protein